MSVLDTLAEIVRNQHLLLSKNANNLLFYGALVHLVFMLCEKPDVQTLDEKSNHLERGTAQVCTFYQKVKNLFFYFFRFQCVLKVYGVYYGNKKKRC